MAPPRDAPFQLKIIYRTPDGGVYMRVLTQVRPVTESRELAETEMNPAVLGSCLNVCVCVFGNVVYKFFASLPLFSTAFGKSLTKKCTILIYYLLINCRLSAKVYLRAKAILLSFLAKKT